MNTIIKKLWNRFALTFGFRQHETPMRDIAENYFKQHAEERDGVMKAYYAYHAPHFRLEPMGHNFLGGLRESICGWCGRSREMVRHDELPAECQKRPTVPEINETILDEEAKATALFDRAHREVPRLVSKLGLSGNTLAVLHHTHGYDPETVAETVDIPSKVMMDYNSRMTEEKNRSRRERKTKCLTAPQH